MDATEHTQSESAPIAFDDQTGQPITPDAVPAAANSTLAVAPETDADGHADRSDQAAVRLSDMAQRLKPVAIVAENAAGRAVDLSARGLARLSEYLERRRQERDRQSDEAPTAD